MHIMPAAPTPVPLEDRPEDELSLEELRQLVKHFKVRTHAKEQMQLLTSPGARRSSNQD
jgi:hypothetical protein